MLRRRVVRDPKKEIASFAITLVIIFALFFAVLNYLVALEHPPTSSASLRSFPLEYFLWMPQTNYREGQAVPLNLSVTNVSSKDVVLRFEQDLEFDFVVQRELNMIFVSVPLDVWRYSASHPPGKEVHQRILKPKQSLTYQAEWPQVNAKGEKVGTGRYLIMGMVLAGKERQVLQIRGRTQ
jgi:hypothetical protein